ncbi:hypothetical protein C5167_042821, partial [Papaver somniferum]
IHQLAVNSLHRSNQIDEMEGGALFVFDLCIFESHEKTGFHEASAFASAFGMQVRTIPIFYMAFLLSFFNCNLVHHLCSLQSKLHDPAPLCTGYYTRTDVEFFRMQYLACGLDTLVESKGFLESFSEEPALVQLHLLTVVLNNAIVEADNPVLRDRAIIICKSNTVLPGCKSTEVIVLR